MKLSPSAFNAKKNHEGLKVIGLIAGKNKYDNMEPVIEALKGINKKDSGFCWSCKCDEGCTEWRFGYSDPEVFQEADDLTDKLMGDMPRSLASMLGIYPEFENANCSCPFSSK